MHHMLVCNLSSCLLHDFPLLIWNLLRDKLILDAIFFVNIIQCSWHQVFCNSVSKPYKTWCRWKSSCKNFCRCKVHTWNYRKVSKVISSCKCNHKPTLHKFIFVLWQSIVQLFPDAFLETYSIYSCFECVNLFKRNLFLVRF